MDLFIHTDKFEVIKPRKVWKRNYNDSKGDFSFLSHKETKLINRLIENDIKINYMVSNGGQYICNLNQYKKESIYIFYNMKKRIYIIKQKFYQIIEGKLEKIKKRDISQEEKFESKILTKNEQPKRYPKNAKFKK